MEVVVVDPAARSRRGRVNDAAALVGRVPALHGLDIVVEPLHGGITNRNYRVAAPDGRAWVARLPGERTELLGIDRAGEAEAAQRAATLGIGPAILGELPEVRTLVTEFVEGTHEDFTPDRLVDVVGLLRTLHNSGPLSHQFPIFRVVEWHARDASTHGVEPPDRYRELHHAASRIEAVFVAIGEPDVPCHNDLLPGNVLFGPERSWLLDYEYAGMNSRWFDLGNLSVNSSFSAEMDDVLLATYFGTATDTGRARLALMKIMSEFREGMWAVVQQAISTLTTIDFVDYAGERLSNCERLVRSPNFTRWLTAASCP
jgi:thiamine kinase-like enzyme